MNIPKKLIKSKTFWTGIATAIAGVILIVKGETNTGIELIAGGLGMIFLRNAIK